MAELSTPDSISGKTLNFSPVHAFDKEFEPLNGCTSHITFSDHENYTGKWEKGVADSDVPEVSMEGKYTYKKLSASISEVSWDGAGVQFLSTLVFTSDSEGYFTSYMLKGHPVDIAHCGTFKVN